MAGEALQPGVKVASDAEARAVQAGTGDYVLGRTLSAVANAGELVQVLLKSLYKSPTPP